ncbi:hypothetical protein HYDPIDRAFT_171259 [Hydnomerulius pinastri MD-312]|uniref:Unplaced genomic scaffold scaffold_102, whole genome shotgun sequence n=1 Tax=Hydnomerulius pinastri MD-312 TaxID=994086 RepID=A0A0C9UZM7_9AGAM|nr:hypothetical protein HYDPIDRAFT_171259 [Hydnomerulius pinastri MD-312]
MSKAEVILCADGHYRRVIYGIGSYLADYPEQVLLTCIVQGWCPRCLASRLNLDGDERIPCHHDHTKLLMEHFTSTLLWKEYEIVDDILPFTASFPQADIHELIPPDILHQLIKGTFKDHLVYLPAIADYLPAQMVQAITAFLDFCYIAHQASLDEGDLDAMMDALQRFHAERVIFEETGVRPLGISIPHIHALQHYVDLVHLFGAPNGLSTSITESKPITAVKKPYRHTNGNQPLSQILVINQHLDNLIHYRNAHHAEGLLDAPLVANNIQAEPLFAVEYDDEEVNFQDDENLDEAEDVVEVTEALVELAKTPSPRHLRTFSGMGEEIGHPELSDLVAHFVYQNRNPNAENPDECPPILTRGYSYSSAVAVFYAPSDLSGVHGMYRFQGLYVAQVILLFSFSHRNIFYPCALVRWFNVIGDQSCSKTGMWMVEPEFDENGDRVVSVIHLDSIM